MEYHAPWKLIESQMGFCHLVYDSQDRLVCTSEGHGGTDARRELDYARLIAAAPDLLAACEAMIARLENMTTDEYQLAGEKAEREAMIAAIAKARGTA